LMQEIVDEISNEFLQEVIQRTPATNNNKLKNNWFIREVTYNNYSTVTTIQINLI
jgi:hypothetical protein